MIFQLRTARLWALGLGVAGALWGCGGGGGSSPAVPAPTTVTPAPTAVVPTNSSLTVQLRDPAGNVVDGLVTLGTRRVVTTNGAATFANIAAGAGAVSAEVNGRLYSQNFVATNGANTVQILIDPALAPTPTGTLPAPPPL